MKTSIEKKKIYIHIYLLLDSPFLFFLFFLCRCKCTNRAMLDFWRHRDGVREHSNITQTMRDHMYIWSHMSFSSLLFIYDVFPSHTHLGQSFFFFFSSFCPSVRYIEILTSFLFYFLVDIAQGEEKILHHLSPRVTSTRRRCIQASSPTCLCFLCFSPLFSLCVCVYLCVYKSKCFFSWNKGGLLSKIRNFLLSSFGYREFPL